MYNSKIQTPAAFAEQYIVESIWNNHFSPGSLLPAERELSELIGVTRTTLREVLQRLSRDGWLTIQHGKPTRVNDYWQTASLNILDTLALLDGTDSLDLVGHLLETRTSILALYLRSALKKNPEVIIKLLNESNNVRDYSEDYIDYDWEFFHKLSRATENPIFTLILNGFKTLYYRVGKFYYTNPDTRKLALDFYNDLSEMVHSGNGIEQINSLIWQYGRDGAELFLSMRADMPALSSLGDDR